MIDPREFALLDRGASQYLASVRKTPTTPQPKKKGFLLDQISTVGGILGGIGGSFIAPIAGTAGGAAAGSALGETLENALMGDKLSKNVGKEALLGGVFAAPPIKAAKALIAARGAKSAGKIAPKSATDVIEGEVVERGGKRTIDDALKTSATGRLDDLANRALTSQYGTISKPVARATHPEETFGTLANYGVTKPKDVENVAQNITGADGLVTRAVSSAVGNAGRVNTDGLRQTLDDALENAGVVDTAAKEVRALFNAQMKKLHGGPSGSLRSDANPTDVIEVMRNLEARIAEKTGRGSNYRLATDATRNQARALRLVRDELEDRLYIGAGANKNLTKVLTPELRDSLIGLKPNDPLWQNFVDTKVMKAKNVAELRGSVAPFVRAGQIIDEADVNSMTFGGRGGNFFNNFQGGLGGAAAGLVTNIVKNPAARAAASTLRTVSGSAPRIPASMGRPAPVGIASRVGTVGAVSGGLNQLGQAAPADAMSLDGALEPPVNGFTELPDNATNPAQTNKSPFASENLQNSIEQILSSGGTMKDAKEFVDMAETLSTLQGAGQTKPLNATQATRAAAANNALKDIPMIAEAIESGRLGGAKALPGSGTQIGRRILGTENLDAALFNIADNILRARTGAAAPEAEVRRFVDTFLPAPIDSAKAKREKLERAIRELQGYVNPMEASTDTLEGALF